MPVVDALGKGYSRDRRQGICLSCWQHSNGRRLRPSAVGDVTSALAFGAKGFVFLAGNTATADDYDRPQLGMCPRHWHSAPRDLSFLLATQQRPTITTVRSGGCDLGTGI